MGNPYRCKSSCHPRVRTRIQVLLEYLRTRPDVDPKRISVVGITWGAPFAILAAKKNPDLNSLVLVNGFAEFTDFLENSITKTLSPLPTFLTQYPARWFTRLFNLYAQAPRVTSSAETLFGTQRVLVIEATQDWITPPSCRDHLLNALEKSNAQVQRILVPGQHIFFNSKKSAARLVEIFEHGLISL